MLKASDFWHLMEQIIPFYVVLMIGYGLTRLNLIAPEHAPGISRWVSMLGVPAYTVHLLAFTDPYQVNLRLVAADVVSKALALFCGCLWWKLSKSGSIEGVIRIFMLATLPNTVLIGDALLQPLCGDEVHTQVNTIILMQSFLWYNICISLYETREVLLQEKQAITPLSDKDSNKGGVIHQELAFSFSVTASPANLSRHYSNLTKGGLQIIEIGVPGWNSNSSALSAGEKYRPGKCSDRFSEKTNNSFGSYSGVMEEESGQKSIRRPGGSALLSIAGPLERTISAAAGFLFPRTRSSTSLSFKRLVPTRNICDVEVAGDDLSASSFVIVEDDLGLAEAPEKRRETESYQHDNHRNSIFKKTTEACERLPVVHNEPVEIRREGVQVSGGHSRARWAVLGMKLINRLKTVPLTYASLIGFVYSLVARKYNWTMPYTVQTTLELISNTTIGMAVFIMGLAWARSGRLISCGWKALAFGVIVRFLIGPILMIISSKITALSGEPFRFSVLQATIPQGVISFVLAKEYGVDVPLFVTAVVFQLLIFVPIVLCYYVILDAL
ncbi:hypothetical protein R1flu_028020 [Riccia fluitans]|uniref:Auxin efflux carrier component n=1 Tax=Riccia fluitans TaxID=41844 RepID=A0ABD1XKJ0_9MARC